MISLIYFINVTEYFTTLTGKLDSRKEKIAQFVDYVAEWENISTLNHLLTDHPIYAISAGQVKEMATILGVDRWVGRQGMTS